MLADASRAAHEVEHPVALTDGLTHVVVLAHQCGRVVCDLPNQRIPG
jgi:hypothetical protein